MSYGCSFPGCDRHPSKGDTILRISAKGGPFVGRCADHYGNEEGAIMAEADERAVAEHMAGNKGFSEETCVRCGWRMGSPPLNCQNDNTPHRFPSQEAECVTLRQALAEILHETYNQQAISPRAVSSRIQTIARAVLAVASTRKDNQA